MSNTIKLKRGSGSDPQASDLEVGELAIRTDSGKIFTKKDNGSVAEISGGGAGLDDGDKGDITVSDGGDTFTIDNGVVTHAKYQDVPQQTILGRALTGTGDVTALSAANVRAIINVENGATADQTASEIVSLISGQNIAPADITSTGDLTLTSTDTGSSASPIIELYRNSASPADADYIGQLKFTGESDDGSKEVYAKMTGKIDDASSGTEDGLIEFALRKAGSNNIGARLTSTDLKLINGTGLEVAGDTTLSGDLTISSTRPRITLNDTDSESDFEIKNENGSFRIRDIDNPTDRYKINTSGTVHEFLGSAAFSSTLNVVSNITVGGTVDGVDIATRDTLFGGLTSSSGVLKNRVTATTQSAGDNSTKVATTAYTDTAISNLVDSSPTALNTLNELAAALGDDANFSTTVTNSIATKLPLAGGTLTGNLSFGDGIKARFGDSQDLELYHSSNNSIINNSASGYLFLQSNNLALRSAGQENMIVGTANGSVDIYHGMGSASSEKKFETTSTGVSVTGNIVVSGTVDGRDLATDGTKLDGIESNATADQTAAEIRTLVESASDSNVFTDADHTKLNGIEANATADQSASEILTLLKTVDGAGSGLDADTLDGVQASALVAVGGDTMTGALRVDISSTVDGILGEAYTGYFGLKHADQTLDSEYMILSSDSHTFISATTGNNVYIRGGGNSSTNQMIVSSSGTTIGGNSVLTSASSLNASNIGSGTLPAARLGAASASEGGISVVGNFGQWESHGTYDNFNTEPAYWGWNFVQGTTNAPNTTSSQWYRCRLSLGSDYGKGSDGGDYSLEMALPRSNHASAGVLHIRTIENGTEGSWTTVGNNASLITTGTLPAARLPNHSADLLTSGTIPAARVPTLNQDTTGSAATLTTARTIAGTSFDGSANIDISYANLTNKLSVGDGGLTQNNFTNTLKSKLDGIAAGATNVTNNNQLTNGAGYITATLTNEQVQDIVGAMVSSNTESGITVTYQDSDGTLDFSVASQTDNNFTNADHSKLDGIESGATADQTASEIRTLVANASDSNVFTDALLSKLNGIASSATNVTNNNQLTNGAGYITTATVADGCVYENSQTISNNYTVTNGKNAMSAGPITIASGVTVTINDGETYTII